MDDRPEGYETIDSRVAYEGAIITVREEDVRLPDGRIVGREMVTHPGAVGIVGITREGKVVLVEQYRNPVKRTLLEIPAGKLSPGEDPAGCAMRELAEETGYRVRTLTKVAEYFTTPGFSNERFHTFLATDIVPGDPEPDGEEEVAMRVVEMPWAEAVRAAREGRIEDGKTLVGLLIADDVLRVDVGAAEAT